MNEWIVFGERLKWLLKERKMSYRELAEKVGLSVPTICRYVQCQRVPKATELLKIANVLGVNCNYLLGVIDDPYRDCLPHPKESTVAENATVQDDLIKRHDAIDAVSELLKGIFVEHDDIAKRALNNVSSAEPEPKCNSCRYRNLEWYKEPCDSCTGGGKNCHYKPEPERLTDDDFETIRIHLNAYKEKLCNQRRWEEAEEYQRIIDRFVSFASAEPEIIRCKDCKWWGREDVFKDGSSVTVCKKGLSANPEGFCHYAEMRGEEDENNVTEKH